MPKEPARAVRQQFHDALDLHVVLVNRNNSVRCIQRHPPRRYHHVSRIRHILDHLMIELARQAGHVVPNAGRKAETFFVRCFCELEFVNRSNAHKFLAQPVIETVSFGRTGGFLAASTAPNCCPATGNFRRFLWIQYPQSGSKSYRSAS